MRGIITGAILVKGERKNALAKALGSRANDDEIDQFVRDCYELISEQMIAQSDLNRLGVKPHIYAAKPEPSGYGALTGSSEITEVGPDGVARSHAELVF